jgi:hypothetical protein
LPPAGDAAAAASESGSTRATGTSARVRGPSSGPAFPGACCAEAGRPWPRWLGCLRAAEPAALATAVTPSFAGRRPAKPRPTTGCPTWQATQTPLLLRERAMDPTACTPMVGPTGGAGERHRTPLLPRRAFLPPTTLGGVDG